MGLHSQRILAQAGFSGVFFAAKILRGELPRYRLPLPEFAANVIPCSAPLKPLGETVAPRVYFLQTPPSPLQFGKETKQIHQKLLAM